MQNIRLVLHGRQEVLYCGLQHFAALLLFVLYIINIFIYKHL